MMAVHAMYMVCAAHAYSDQGARSCLTSLLELLADIDPLLVSTVGGTESISWSRGLGGGDLLPDGGLQRIRTRSRRVGRPLYMII